MRWAVNSVCKIWEKWWQNWESSCFFLKPFFSISGTHVGASGKLLIKLDNVMGGKTSFLFYYSDQVFEPIWVPLAHLSSFKLGISNPTQGEIKSEECLKNSKEMMPKMRVLIFYIKTFLPYELLLSETGIYLMIP